MEQRRDYSKNKKQSEWFGSYFEEPEDSSFLTSPTNWICQSFQYFSPTNQNNNYNKSLSFGTTTNISSSSNSNSNSNSNLKKNINTNRITTTSGTTNSNSTHSSSINYENIYNYNQKQEIQKNMNKKFNNKNSYYLQCNDENYDNSMSNSLFNRIENVNGLDNNINHNNFDHNNCNSMMMLDPNIFSEITIPSSSKILAPNVSKLLPGSMVEVILKSTIEEVSILCSVDVLKMRSLYFQSLLLEQEQPILPLPLSSTSTSASTSISLSDIMWRSPLYILESSPYEAAAFLESIHEGKGFYNESWNLTWARLSISWKINDIIEEYSIQIEKHIQNLFTIIQKNHWRVNPNYFVGSKIAVFRKSNGPLPLMLIGYVVEGSSSTPYSHLRVSFEIDNVNNNNIHNSSNNNKSNLTSYTLSRNYCSSSDNNLNYYNSSNDDNKSIQSDDSTLNNLQNKFYQPFDCNHNFKKNNISSHFIQKGSHSTKIPQKINSINPLSPRSLKYNANFAIKDEERIETRSESGIRSGTGILEIKTTFNNENQTQSTARVLTLKEIRDQRLFKEKQKIEDYKFTLNNNSNNNNNNNNNNIHINPIGEVNEPFWIQNKIDQQWNEADEICESYLKKLITEEDKRILWEMISIIMENTEIFQENNNTQSNRSNNNNNLDSINYDFPIDQIYEEYEFKEKEEKEKEEENNNLNKSNIIKDINNPHKLALLFQRKEYHILWSLQSIDFLPFLTAIDLIRDVFTSQK